MLLTAEKMQISHKEGDNYYLKLIIVPNHNLHVVLSLGNCLAARTSLMDTVMENPSIVKDGSYFRINKLLGVNLVSNELELNPPLKDVKITFHSELLNLDTAIAIGDVIEGNR